MKLFFRFASLESFILLFILCSSVGFGTCQIRGGVIDRGSGPTTQMGVMVTNSSLLAESGHQCVCHFEHPALPEPVLCQDYVETGYPERLEDLETHISELSQELDEYTHTVIRLHTDLEIVGSQLNLTLDTLEGVLEGTVVITVSELEVFKDELKDMSLILERVEAQAAEVPEVQQLRDELDNFSRIMSDLSVTRPNEVRVLRRKIDELKAKLVECERSYPTDDDDDLFQPWSGEASQDSCRELIHVSEPFTVRGRGGRTGAWFRDPVLDYQMVWYVPFHNPRLTYQVDRFANVADFSRGTRYESRHMMLMDYPCQGPGMVAYNGSLYFHVYESRQIVRYHVANRTVVAKTELNDAVIENLGSYMAEGYTDIDLAVDEAGLWVIYIPLYDQSKTAVSRLDPESLEVLGTWLAPIPKYRAGNCFMVCSKLYCISSYFSTEAKVLFTYDTATDSHRALDIPFDIRFGEMLSLDYNPRDQKLYGWDNGHQVVYDLTFDPAPAPTPEAEVMGTLLPLPVDSSSDSGVLELGLQ